MTTVELLGAGLALLAAVGVGTIAHELSHAITLRAVGVSYEFEWNPTPDGTGARCTRIADGLAAVKLRRIPEGLAPWKIRAAALMPFLLSAPFALVLLGVVPDPFEAGDIALRAASVGWLACALPSPKDFSMVWYPRQVLGLADEDEPSSSDLERTT